MKPDSAEQLRHPSAFEPSILGLNIILSFFGAIIGLQIYASLGFVPNTAIIGVLVAIMVSRIPISFLSSFRNIQRQNLIQSTISSATFAAANSMLLPLGVMYIMGKIDLAIPMLVGCIMGMLIDLFMLYWMFDSKTYPGEAPWPPGYAAAEAIIAGDRGGKRALMLVGGIVAGAAGSFLKIPMAAMGSAMIANIWAMLMFAAGLLMRGYSVQLFGFDINKAFIPHGVMIGAGVVACLQIVVSLYKKKEQQQTVAATAEQTYTRTDEDVRRGIKRGACLYVAGGIVLCGLTGLYAAMSPGMLAIWVAYAATACILSEFIIGLSAMQSGWFPAFPVSLIFLIIGMIIGFPPVALAVLVGFIISGGPAFADAGYDFKAGWLLRGKGNNIAFELEGRKQQLFAGMTGFAVAIVVVYFFHEAYFGLDMFPPPSRLFAATISAGINPEVIRSLALWAIPGAILQFIGGPERQMGVLMGTGLLILNPKAGMVVLVGLAIRLAIIKLKGKEAYNSAVIVAAGCIAGDAIFGFFNSIVKTSIGKVK